MKNFTDIYPKPPQLPQVSGGDLKKYVYVNMQTFGNVGDGADGDVTISDANTIVNEYGAISHDVSPGDIVITFDTHTNENKFDFLCTLLVKNLSIRF